MADKTAVIIGAGVLGCSIAYALAKAGYRAIDIDKLPAPGYGSTSSSCAIVRFTYSTLSTVSLAYEGYHYWKDWSGFLGAGPEEDLSRYLETGHLVLRTSADDRRETIELYRQLGISYEEWSLDQIRDRLPLLDLHRLGPPVRLDDPAFYSEQEATLEGGVYLPQGGYVTDPQLAARNLYAAARRAGATFMFNREVASIDRRGGRVCGVTLVSGEVIEADIVVNVAGPHSAIINRMAGVEEDMSVRTRALRREVHHVPAPQGFDPITDMPVMSDPDAGVYLRPETGRTISIGSTDPVCDEKTWVDDPDTVDRNITDVFWKTQVYRFARRMPTLPIPNQGKGVVDMYDVSDDWTPIYDRSSLPGFYMAIGTSGHQFKNAGVVGVLMATLIDACEAGLDHDARPLSITGTYTGLPIDLGAFSRLRDLNSKSSFSVRG